MHVFVVLFFMCIWDNFLTLYVDRDAGNGLHIFRFDLKMNATSLKDTLVPYKYVIFSNRFTELSDPYELLYGVPHTYPSDILNRCLWVPHNKCHPKGAQIK